MRSYDVPQMRKGVLGDMAIDVVDSSVKENTTRLKARVQELKESFYEVKKLRGKLTASLASRGATRIGELQKVQSSFDTLKVHGLGKAMKAAKNEITGMLSEAQAHPSRTMLPSQQLTELLKRIKAEYQSSKQRVTAVAIPYDALNDDAKQALSEQDKHASKMQLNGRPYIIARAPIIPIAGYLDFQVIKRSGVPVENIGGYVMLKDQRVIGLSKQEGKALEQAKEIAELVSNVAGQVMFLVSDKATRYKGNLWYWLADKHTLSTLRKAGHGQFKLNDWGFGFSSEI